MSQRKGESAPLTRPGFLHEGFFRTLVNCSLDGIMVLNREGTIQWANQACADIVGVRPEEMIEKSVFPLLHPDDVPMAARVRENLLRNPGARECVTSRILRRDGSWRIVEGLGTSFMDESGEIFTMSTLRDITDRKRTEEALRESEERFQTLIHTVFDGIAIHEDNRIVEVSPAFAQVLGCDPSDIVGKSGMEFVTPESAELMQRRADDGYDKPYEVTILRKDGSTVPLEIVGKACRYQGRKARIVAFRDLTEKKRMAEALRETQEQMRSVLENSPDLILIVDANGRIQFVNRILPGYEPGRILGSNLYDFAKPEDHDRVRDSLAQVFELGIPVCIKAPGPVIDGHSSWYETRFAPIRQDGRIVKAVVIASDITERKQIEDELAAYHEHLERLVAERTAELTQVNEQLLQEIAEHKRTEQALRDSEERFRELTDLLPQTVFEIDLEGNLTFANRFAFESTGYADEDLARGKNCLELFIPEDRSRVKENMRRRLTGEITGGKEYTMLRKDGSTFPVLTYSSPILRDGEPVGFRGIAVDITEQKRADDALRKSENELRILLEATHDAACLLDPQGTLVVLNENFASRFGKHVHDLVGKSVFDLLPPDLAESRLQKAREAISSHQCVHAEDEREGRITYSSYCPVFDDKGDLVRFAIFARDITEQRQAEQRVRQLERQQIETEKLAATGRMAARIAHEINNPLGGIKNSFQLIKDAIPQHHPHYPYVGRIEREVERITRIVRQMIDLHRPEPLLSSRFRLDQLIRDVVALLEHNAREHFVVMEVDTQAARATLTMPEDPLRQILNNIVLNAIEASPQGGIVSISAKVTGETLRIEVSDQGSGIPEQARSRIYEPFYTTKNSRMTGGLGLGLAISKNLVEALGGDIDFESQPDQGTTFTITLPIQSE